MTPEQIQEMIDNGTFVSVLMDSTNIIPREAPDSTPEHPVTELTFEFPAWFRLLTQDTQSMIRDILAETAPIAYMANRS